MTQTTLTIAANVKAFRQSAGYTQQHVADHLGVSRNQMQRYERGETRISSARLERIAEFLGIDYQDFFMGQVSLAIKEGEHSTILLKHLQYIKIHIIQAIEIITKNHGKPH